MEEEKKPAAFQIYFDTYQHIQLLNREQRGDLFTALFEYAINGKQTEFDDGMLQMAFSFMRSQIDRDFIKYRKRCETNRANATKRKQSQADDYENSQ